jgi:hypothetical protein
MKIKIVILFAAIFLASFAAVGLARATLMYDYDYYGGVLNQYDAGWTDTYPRDHFWNILPGFCDSEYYGQVAMGYQYESEDPYYELLWDPGWLSQSTEGPAACFWFAPYGDLGYTLGVVGYWTDLD